MSGPSASIPRPAMSGKAGDRCRSRPPPLSVKSRGHPLFRPSPRAGISRAEGVSRFLWRTSASGRPASFAVTGPAPSTSGRATAGVWKRSPNRSLTMCSPGSVPSSHRQHGQPMNPLSREGPSRARCPPRFHFPYAETPAYACAGKCLTFGNQGVETVAGWLPASLAVSGPKKAAGFGQRRERAAELRFSPWTAVRRCKAFVCSGRIDGDD